VQNSISDKADFNLKPAVNMLIQCFNEIPENATEEDFYDAKKVKMHLETKYKIRQ